MAEAQVIREFGQLLVQELKGIVGERGLKAVLQDSGIKMDEAGTVVLRSEDSVRELAALAVRGLKTDFGDAFPERILLNAYAKLREKHPDPGELSEMLNITTSTVLQVKE